MLLGQSCHGYTFINNHADCQVPIEFEASRLLQTDSEVLLTDSNLT